MTRDDLDTEMLQDVAEAILWAPDHPGIDKMYEVAKDDLDDPELTPWEWVGALKLVARRGVCLVMKKDGSRVYMTHEDFSYKVEGPNAGPDEVAPSNAEELVADADEVWPVMQSETPFGGDESDE